MSAIQDVIARVKEKDSGQPEFLQAVQEVLTSLEPTAQKHPDFVRAKIYDRIVEPDRVIMFRVAWVDDRGEVQVNRGFRVQFNNAIGPYKGGLRFHPSVNLGIIKFLGFEQTFKNSLTTLPMGGAKGGSDFNPKGKSDQEVMRFCQAFMRELYRHIGPDTDVPAGDIGVGEREIGYLYGYYLKIVNANTSVLTGKGLEYGGSLIRPEATGYGAVYFAAEMLATRNLDLRGKTAVVSGSGNVAQYTVEKLLHMGARPITLSDSDGTIVDEAGIDGEKLRFVFELKNYRRGRIREYAEKYNVPYFANQSVWDVVREQGLKVDVAFPSAHENEIDGPSAEALVKNGCYCVAEGANMPSNLDAVRVFQENHVLYGPGKAANAGGVAVSGLEMAQNAMRLSWSREEVDQKLQGIMRNIHRAALEASEAYGCKGNYVMGANIAGFLKVAKAMLAYGIV
ncbi:MAG TPA: NADP-specific glutamate dehydrogenase [Anaerolinea thermolimosa]|uniref:Glutamate dehydrogenase n=1 Tax=Anaerolinea thermolimosa TaxID=229919 RepID=A0A3D1JEU2_9CHLR|nr:NADP-specific glutamate dehydrogenase [Anaerolinea thermolimosa]GAP08382.1 glutamate/leucine dehydrogenase [Anaerolinea thermolimosa]HCE16964.1 NADP-specific glutamate dehydrogenase [Anaerolinea thermolimosa]